MAIDMDINAIMMPEIVTDCANKRIAVQYEIGMDKDDWKSFPKKYGFPIRLPAILEVCMVTHKPPKINNVHILQN